MGTNPGGYTPTATGTYQWVAVYTSPDVHNSNATSPFGSEPWTVGQQSPTVLTTTPNVTSVTLTGGSVTLTDTANLMNLAPGGSGDTITFYLMPPAYNTSTDFSKAVFSSLAPFTINSDGTATVVSASYTLPAGAAIGTYQWDAVYSGDSDNTGDSFLNDPTEQVLVVAQGTISGTVYCDTNLNGVFDTGDQSDSGAVVTLTGTDFTGAGVTKTVTTGLNRSYSFAVAPGSYTVKLTTPSSGDVAEMNHGTVTITTSYAAALGSGGSSANNNFAQVDLGSLSGTVFLDVNDSGTQGDTAGETGVAGVTITLTGADYLGGAVSKTSTTGSDGKYSFTGLLPSSSTGYTIKETQLAGYLDGIDKVGTINGVTVGAATTNDTISCIVLPGCANNGINYTFGEHGIFHGLTATIGFWHNQNGQGLIKSFGNASNGLSLANTLAVNLPNLFGAKAPAFNVNSTIGTNLTNRSDSDVAAYFLSLFGVSGQKAYAQVLASALATFTTTNSTNTGATSRALAIKYGFALSNTGAGAATYVVPQADWPAFGLTSSTAVQSINRLILLAYNYAVSGKLNGGNATQITQTNDVFNAINNQGDIGIGMNLIAAYSGGADATWGSLGQVYSGTYLVAIDTLTDSNAADEYARIQDALDSFNQTLGVFGVSLAELPADVSATPDIQIHMQDSSVIGDAADGVLGVTSLGGNITLIEGWNYYAGASAADIGANQYDFQTVVSHELGHAMGLGHSQDAASVMYPYLATGEVRRTMTASDLSEIDADRNGEPEPLMAAPNAIDSAVASRAPAAPILSPNASSAAQALVSSPALDFRGVLFAEIGTFANTHFGSDSNSVTVTVYQPAPPAALPGGATNRSTGLFETSAHAVVADGRAVAAVFAADYSPTPAVSEAKASDAAAWIDGRRDASSQPEASHSSSVEPAGANVSSSMSATPTEDATQGSWLWAISSDALGRLAAVACGIPFLFQGFRDTRTERKDDEKRQTRP
jgi:hypothetical protein